MEKFEDEINSVNNLAILKEDISNLWNPKRFDILRSPQFVGEIHNKKSFATLKTSVLDMLIKKPYSDDIVLPFSDKAIDEIVRKCVEFEKQINVNYEEYYMYLTIDQRFVEAGNTQRNPGVHFDGMQGTAYPEKLPVCHSYLISDYLPTRFFYQSFLTNLDENKQNWFYEFGKVADINKSLYSKPYQIFFMTAYNVHESTIAKENVMRTFMRIEFSKKQFNRLGNSINPLLESSFNYIERNIPKHLQMPYVKENQ